MVDTVDLILGLIVILFVVTISIAYIVFLYRQDKGRRCIAPTIDKKSKWVNADELEKITAENELRLKEEEYERILKRMENTILREAAQGHNRAVCCISDWHYPGMVQKAISRIKLDGYRVEDSLEDSLVGSIFVIRIKWGTGDR